MINATLFVQIINFGIVCLVLDKVLLRYAVREIDQEKKNENSARSRIDNLQTLNDVRVQEKENDWRIFKNQLKTLIPELPRKTDRFLLKDQDELKAHIFSEQEFDSYKKKMVALIIESVRDVH